MDKNNIMNKFFVAMVIIISISALSYAVYSEIYNPGQCCVVRNVNENDPTNICPDGSKGRVNAILIAGSGDIAYEDVRDSDEAQFRSDVSSFASKLRSLGVNSIATVYYDREKPLQSAHFAKRAMQSVQRNQRDCDTLIFVFVGHGGSGSVTIGTKYLPPRNPGESAQETDEVLSSGDLTLFAKKTKGKKLFLFDSCGSGALAKEVSRIGYPSTVPNTITIGSTAGGETCPYFSGASSSLHYNFNQNFIDSLVRNSCIVSDAYNDMARVGAGGVFTQQGYSSGSIHNTIRGGTINIPCSYVCAK